MESLLKRLAVIFLVGRASAALADSPRALRIPLNASSISLDPTGVQDQSSLWVSRQVNCQLVRLVGGNTVPEAAKSVQFDGPKTIKIMLSDNATFADGSSITVDDVVASFANIKQSRGVLRNIFPWISSLEKVGPKELTIHLSQPVPHFLRVMASPNYSLFKAEFIARARVNPALWNQPVGCGKYKIGGHSADGTVHLEPRKGGRPIDFVLTKGNEVSAGDVAQYDLVGLSIEGDPAQIDSTHRRELLFDPYQVFLALNSQRPSWSDAGNRCALFRQLDSRRLLKSYGDRAEDAVDLFPRGIVGFSKSTGFKAHIAASGSAVPVLPKGEVCVSMLGVSIPSTHRQALKETVEQAFGPVNVRIMDSAKRFGATFRESGCEALVLGLKSNYLDGYEYLAMLSGAASDVVNLAADDPLRRRIDDSQDIADARQRAQNYQEISGEVRDRCLIYPLITIPRKAIFVRKGLVTPHLGEVSLNEYDLSGVK